MNNQMSLPKFLPKLKQFLFSLLSIYFFRFLSPNFMSKLVHRLAFGTPKFYIAPYDQLNHGLANLNCNCGLKSDLRLFEFCIHTYRCTVYNTNLKSEQKLRIRASMTLPYTAIFI